MDVNAMPGLVMDESEDESLDMEGGVNALQVFFFCKKPGHKKIKCRKFDGLKYKNPTRKTGSNTMDNNTRNGISCYNCGKEGHISRKFMK